MKSDEELKQEDPELYKVARRQGTERPFSGEYVDLKEDGMFHCAVCDTPLFSSEEKFDSGSGWPSFSSPTVKDAVELREDLSHGMKRTEVVCKKCQAHLGHVFDEPTSLKLAGQVARLNLPASVTVLIAFLWILKRNEQKLV